MDRLLWTDKYLLALCDWLKNNDCMVTGLEHTINGKVVVHTMLNVDFYEFLQNGIEL